MSCVRQPNAEPIPGYRLIEPLGSGGFGEVWKCEAPGGLFKAIKFVYGNLRSLDMEGARAEQELSALQRIKEVRHPFVLSLDQIKDLDGELLIVMELADKSLYDALIEFQSAGMVGIPRDTLLRYIRDAAEALDHMNEKHNLQHLDIKPRNLFLISDRVKVADFGLVNHHERHRDSGSFAGATPLYAPPETYSGKISHNSDQYSLAIVYQELLTGTRPFNGKNPRQLAQQHLQEEPELRSLPEAERPIVARALSKDPNKRYPGCLAFVRALYMAQGKMRLDDARTGAAHGKSLHETLEDISLEDWGHGELREDSPPEALADAENSRLGLTLANPESGALRPTMILGLGGFGKQALSELRCRFTDRFGDLHKVPLLRFLYVDSDKEAVQGAQRGAPETALSRNEVYHLPLQGVGHYRRRMLDHLNDWMPREKLYGIPRSLQTQGSRALGRLAFVDNHLRFLARLRREIQQAGHPDSLYQSVTQTGLALRDGVPRVYVIAAAAGGASGYLADLGYAVRKLLQHLRFSEAEILLFLCCGAPADPATPRGEQANIYATLTELNHYSDPAVPFAAQYGVDGPRLVDTGNPFTSIYLLQQADRRANSLREVVAHLGNYLFHELTTPLGARLDQQRHRHHRPAITPFRSFGTYAVWFPRGLLLRLAARQACHRLFEDWQAEGEPTAAKEVDAACARMLAEPGIRPETLAVKIEEAAGAVLGTRPDEALTAILSTLEDQAQQSVAQESPGSWAKQALLRVKELVGLRGAAEADASNATQSLGDWRKSKLSRALSAAVDQLAREWDQRLASVAFKLMDHPGRRVAAAMTALKRFARFCEEAGAAQRARCQQQSPQVKLAYRQLEAALSACLGEGSGTWTFSQILSFGNRNRRSLRVFVDHLAAYARRSLTAEIIGAVQLFFGSLGTRLNERIRELGLVRQRLLYLQTRLESPVDESNDLAATHLGTGMTPSPSAATDLGTFWESLCRAATVRVVLPDGETDLYKASQSFINTLTPDHWVQLDQVLQDQILSALGGLQTTLAGSGDPVRTLGVPLVEQAASFLGQLLPITDVAQVEQATMDPRDRSALEASLTKAATLVGCADSTKEVAYLLVPASDAGKRFGEAAIKQIPTLQVLRVAGQAHLLFCREIGYLSIEDLQRTLRPCRGAYEESAVVPHASSHARFDVMDWIPLDP